MDTLELTGTRASTAHRANAVTGVVVEKYRKIHTLREGDNTMGTRRDITNGNKIVNLAIDAYLLDKRECATGTR